MSVVESHDEALQVTHTLFAPHQRPEISLDVFVCRDLGPLISWPKRAGRTIDCLSASNASNVSRKPPALTISTNGVNASGGQLS